MLEIRDLDRVGERGELDLPRLERSTVIFFARARFANATFIVGSGRAGALQIVLLDLAA